MSDLFSLDGRVIVITGGLGQLGRQFTTALRAQGARVAIIDQAVGTSDDADVMVLRADITDRASVQAAADEIVAAWGVPFGLINNAALDSPPGAPAEENGPFETYPASSWEKVMSVNVTGVLNCCQVFGGAMAEAGRGSIVNIGSIYGLVSPDQRIYEYRRTGGETFFKPIAYSASKSALLNMTRYLATYWAPRQVRVNIVTFAGVFNGQDQQFLDGYLARVPLGRMARPDEYNGAIVFLMSEASSYMTGSNMVIDGGWTAW
jgi:NAD(P)-dependent dehydrogenase (short-subunit alcohol dehydrogenase family)